MGNTIKDHLIIRNVIVTGQMGEIETVEAEKWGGMT